MHDNFERMLQLDWHLCHLERFSHLNVHQFRLLLDTQNQHRGLSDVLSRQRIRTLRPFTKRGFWIDKDLPAMYAITFFNSLSSAIVT